MGKIFLLVIIMLLAFTGYWLQKKGRDSLNILPRGKKINIASKGLSLDKKKDGINSKFKVGDCLKRSSSGFNFTKIIKVEQDIYHIQECVKYKKCQSEVKKISWKEFHYAFITHRKIKCP